MKQIFNSCITKCTLITFLILSFSYIKAQNIDDLKKLKIKSSIVAEGLPYDYQVVLNADSSEAYFYSYFNINDIYSSKYNEAFDTIVIISKGPFYQSDRISLLNNKEYAGKYSTDMSIPPLPNKPMYRPSHTPNYISLRNEVKSVIFGERNNEFHNGYPVFTLSDIFFIDSPSSDSKVIDYLGFTFNDLDMFYSFLSKDLKLNIPANKFLNFRIKQNQERYDQHLDSLVNSNKKNKKKLKSGSENLSIVMDNENIIFSNNKYIYTFDILIQSNEASTYLNGLSMWIKYNNDAFGENVIANQKLRATASSFFNDPSYRILSGDINQPNTFGLSIENNTSNTVPNRTEVSNNQYTKVISIEIDLIDCQKPANFIFDNVSFTSNFSTYTTSSNQVITGNFPDEYYSYSSTSYQILSSPAQCTIQNTPFISNISPLTLNAGTQNTNDILTISGNGFGVRNPKAIQFRNAEFSIGNTNPFVLGVDDSDILSWTDTEIRIQMPSSVIIGDYLPGDKTNRTAGSGEIRIILNNNVILTSTQKINVKYAFTNVEGIGVDKKYFLHGRFDCINGLEFILHNNFQSNPNMITVIEKVLSDWSSIVGIYLGIKKNSNGDILYTTNTPSNTDNINVIYLDPNLKSGSNQSLMTTLAQPGYCLNEFILLDSDIRIAPQGLLSNQVNWNLSTSGNVLSGQYDFYHAFSHEIGHALGMDHVIDPVNGELELMNSSSSDNFKSESNRTNLTSGGKDGVIGATNKMLISKSILWNCNAGQSRIDQLIDLNLTHPLISASGETTFCSGENVILSSNSNTHDWYSMINGLETNENNAAKSHLVTKSGKYYTKYTDSFSSCEYKSNSIEITVNPTPTISSQPVNQNVCDDTPAYFNTSVTGGSNLDYQWYYKSKNGATFSPINALSIFRYSGSTSADLTVNNTVNFDGYSFYCEITNEFGCTTTTNTALLNVDRISFDLPVSTVFSNSSAFTLTGGNPSGGVYSGTGVTSNSFNPSIGAGTYTITYTKEGCRRNSKDDIKVINCSGTCKVITVDKVDRGYFCFGGNSFLYFNVDFTSVGNFTQTGKMIAQLSNSFGSFNNPTKIGEVNFSNSGTIACTIPDNTPVGLNYRIRVISENNSDAQSSDNGIALRVYPGSQNCNTIVPPIRKLFNSLLKNGIVIYPNPTTGILTLFEQSINDTNPLLISVYDSFGNLIMERLLDSPTTILDISHLSDGLYLINYELNGDLLSERIILSKN